MSVDDPIKYEMPDKPTTFTSRSRPSTKRAGGSAHLRDRTAAYRRVCEQLLNTEPLCRYCRSMRLVRGATVVDHIIALGIGGTNDPANLASACTDCNDAKSTAEKRFLAKGYDVVDVMRDPVLAD